MKTFIKLSDKTRMLLSIILISLMSISVNAQQDTTKLEFGKKKIFIVEGETHKKQAIDNLQKGIATFKAEIKKSEKDIEILQSKNEEFQKQMQTAANSTDSASIERQIYVNTQLVAANEQKIKAFTKGIVDIEDGIAEIEKELWENWIRDDSTLVINIDTIRRVKQFNAHFAGFEMGIVNFLNPSMSLASDQQANFMSLIPEKSFSYSINLFEKSIPITKKALGLATGAGLQWNSFALTDNINLYEDENGVMQAETIDPTVIDYTKNKLNMAYLTIPLILELQIPLGKEKIYISGGMTGSLRLWSKQKQKYFEKDVKMKNKVLDDFQLTPFRYGTTFRIGYGNVGLFANYELTSLFKENTGPELYPITVGVTLINF